MRGDLKQRAADFLMWTAKIVEKSHQNDIVRLGNQQLSPAGTDGKRKNTIPSRGALS